jgi:hypothetical protein
VRIITVTVLLMTLTLTAGPVKADLREACLSNCELNKRSCDAGCPPGGPFTEDTRVQCLQDCRDTFISCRSDCPQPESTSSPSPYSSSSKSFSAKTADNGMLNESSK